MLSFLCFTGGEEKVVGDLGRSRLDEKEGEESERKKRSASRKTNLTRQQFEKTPPFSIESIMPKAAKKEKVSKRSAKNEDTKKRKRKAKKDPNAPKNPMSAYLLFCEEWREKVKAANPDSSFGKLFCCCFFFVGRGRGKGGRGGTSDAETIKEKRSMSPGAYAFAFFALLENNWGTARALSLPFHFAWLALVILSLLTRTSSHVLLIIERVR